MARVFIAHRPTRPGRVNVYDYSPAEQFGKIVDLVDPEANPLKQPDEIAAQIYHKLDTMDVSSDDYILLTGNPIVIGMVTAIAADLLDGRVKFLQWNGRDKVYFPVEVDLERLEWNGEKYVDVSETGA